MTNADKRNYIKTAIVLVLVIIACATTGCASYGNGDIIDKSEKVEIADEFEMVYGQNTVFYIYRHVPTDMMFVSHGQGIESMGITYQEYIEKAKAFHEENDKVIETGTNDSESVKGSGYMK